LVLIVLLFFAAVTGFQWASGAFRAEFGHRPDESAHYVSGLMIRDYIAALAPAPPIRFAEDYYLHYPKMAMGHWPPFFYVVEAAWMLVFSPSRLSVLALLALLTTLLALTLHLALRSEFSTAAGVASGLLLISLPMTQAFSGMVMAEMLVALLMFSSVLVFARYLDTERWQDAAWFGLLASFAILTKGTGFTLALIPPIAVVLTRKFRLLVRPSFWLPAGIVLLLCGPWHYLAPGAMHDAAVPLGRLKFEAFRIWYLPRMLIHLTGAGILLLSGIGFSVQILYPIWKRQKLQAKWSATAALVVGFLVFRTWVGAANDPRHLTILAPPLLMFLVAAVAWLAPRLPLGPLSARQKMAVVAAVIGLVFAVEKFTIPEKPSFGFQEVAQDLLARPEFRNSVFLISSEGLGEGRFISEVAMRERRPGHYVLRGSKMLARTSWFGHYYTPLYQTRAELMDYLDSIPVGILVMDHTPGWRQLQHHRLLNELLETYRDRWKLIGTYPRDRRSHASQSKILVYRLVGHEMRPVGRIRIDLRPRLGRFLEN
jgi:hypothetical protein